MKPPPDNPEFARFTDALQHMLKVPKTAVEAQMKAEKRKRAKTRATKSHAGTQKDG